MKKLNFVLMALFVSTLFISCNKDDDASPELTGSWEFVSERVIFLGNDTTSPYDDHEPGCTKDFVTFTNDKLITNDYFGSTCELDVFEQTYTRNGNALTVNDSGDIYEATIEILNESTLVVKVEEESLIGTYVNYTTFSRK